jgi:hypothetical protein
MTYYLIGHGKTNASDFDRAKYGVTHGLVIAAVKYALGMTEGGLEPENCEIVEINL